MVDKVVYEEISEDCWTRDGEHTHTPLCTKDCHCHVQDEDGEWTQLYEKQSEDRCITMYRILSRIPDPSPFFVGSHSHAHAHAHTKPHAFHALPRHRLHRHGHRRRHWDRLHRHRYGYRGRGRQRHRHRHRHRGRHGYILPSVVFVQIWPVSIRLWIDGRVDSRSVKGEVEFYIEGEVEDVRLRLSLGLGLRLDRLCLGLRLGLGLSLGLCRNRWTWPRGYG